MEEAFMQLHKEFRQLQAVCSRQAELLQKFTGKKTLSTEIPFSMPIQCTDAGDPEQCDDHLSGQKAEDLDGETLTRTATKSPQPAFPGKKHCGGESLPSLDITVPPCLEKYTLFNHGEKEVSAQVLYNLDISAQQGGNETDLGGLIKRYGTSCPATDSNKENTVTCHKAQDLPFLHQSNAAPFNSLSDLYNLPHCLQSEIVSVQDGRPAEATFPMGIRGPAQTSWSPECMSEDCPLGHSERLNSDSFGLTSQTCDFCQAVFPAGAATKGEYLRHLTAHIE